MSDELKPCPFCGGQAHIDGGSIAEYHGRSHMDVWVACMESGARGPQAEDTDPDAASYAAPAIAAWNRRDGGSDGGS